MLWHSEFTYSKYFFGYPQSGLFIAESNDVDSFYAKNAWIKITCIKYICTRDAYIVIDFASNPYCFRNACVKSTDTESFCIWGTCLYNAYIEIASGVNTIKHLRKYLQFWILKMR